MREPIPYRVILASIWLTIASVAGLALLYAIHYLLFHVLVAAFLAVVLNRPVAWFVRHRWPRGVAIGVVVLGTFLLVVGIAASIAGPLATQGVNVARHAPDYLRQAEQGRGPVGHISHRFHLERQLRKAGPAISRSLSTLSSRLLNFGRAIVSATVSTALTLVLMIFLLVQGPALAATANRIVPRDRRGMARRIGEHVAESVSSYTVGIVLLAALNGIVAAFLLEITRVPFVLPLAMWAGVVDILPIIGGLLGIVIVGLFAFAKSVVAGIVVVVVMLVYQQVKNHLLYPVVVGRAVQLNALVVLLAVLAGAELAKIGGALLAIPVAAVVHVAISETLGPRFPWLADEPKTHEEAAPTREAS